MDSLQQQKTYINSRDFETNLEKINKGIKIYCEYCTDYLCVATETQCGHIFCEQCIEEYLLYLDACPLCSTPLRKTTRFSNIPLDNIIEDYVRSAHPKTFSSFRKRLDAFRKLKKESFVRIVSKGMEVDIRDAHYVWCTGTVQRVIESQNKRKRWIMVHYDDSQLIEAVDLQSGRVAVLGTYTDRKKLPHYSKGRVVMQQCFGLQIQLTEFRSPTSAMPEQWNQVLLDQ